MDEDVLYDLALYYAEIIDSFPDELLEQKMHLAIEDVYVGKGFFECRIILEAKDLTLLA